MPGESRLEEEVMTVVLDALDSPLALDELRLRVHATYPLDPPVNACEIAHAARVLTAQGLVQYDDGRYRRG